MGTKYTPGQHVICNGNPEGVILRAIAPTQYEVRLWQGGRHGGDVVTCDADLDIENAIVETDTKLNHKVTDAEILRFMASCEETESNTQVKLNAIAAKLERLETLNAELLAALNTCTQLFAAIRSDWTDPRQEIREGIAVIHAAIAAATPDAPESETAELCAWKWATTEQGYLGTFQNWLVMPKAARQQYEDGAAGIPTEETGRPGIVRAN